MVASSISVAHSPARLVVEARDLRTFEIRQFFPLPETESTTTEYLTDMYFFFPAGFGPVTDTLSNRDFYKRSQVYMRMHSPDLKLQEFAGIMLEQIMAQGIRDGEVITREIKDAN